MPRTHLDAAGHPRPQLIRHHDWRDLSGPWGLVRDDADRGRAERWMDQAAAAVFTDTVTVPYPPESAASGAADSGFHPVLWYRREFEAARPAAGRRLLLHFGAVDYSARVWVNGVPVGRHEGGHTPFTCDVTDALTEEGAQAVVVRAEDRPLDATQPRGKQDWRRDPHVIWYHRTSGIWQPVWLEEVADQHAESVHWTPDVAGARVRCELRLARWPRRPVRVAVRLSVAGRVLAEQTVLARTRETAFDVAVPDLCHGQVWDELLWSPERPTLVDASVELRDGGDSGAQGGDAAGDAAPPEAADKVLDRFDSYLGLRDVGWDDGVFLLNHKPYFLRMALQQGYWPGSHLAAPGEELRREAELAKEIGLNGLRIHQKLEDPRFLYWADRIGLVLWGEMPSAYAFGTQTVERVAAEWTEALARDRSHPSIVAWVPVNETWSAPTPALVPQQRSFLDMLYHLTKSLDPSRPAVSNDGWEISAADIWGVHDYTQHAEVLRERYGSAQLRRGALPESWPAARRLLLEGTRHEGQPVVLSEFGGAAFAPREGEEWFGYDTVATPEEFAERLDALVGAAIDSGLAGYCYTQFTDTAQEVNGLLTAERTPKIPTAALRGILARSRKPYGRPG
ncbi:glycoside hydrolase family 2 protein [Nocardiopsis coralliicola]